MPLSSGRHTAIVTAYFRPRRYAFPSYARSSAYRYRQMTLLLDVYMGSAEFHSSGQLFSQLSYDYESSPGRMREVRNSSAFLASFIEPLIYDSYATLGAMLAITLMPCGYEIAALLLFLCPALVIIRGARMGDAQRRGGSFSASYSGRQKLHAHGDMVVDTCLSKCNGHVIFRQLPFLVRGISIFPLNRRMAFALARFGSPAMA